MASTTHQPVLEYDFTAIWNNATLTIFQNFEYLTALEEIFDRIIQPDATYVYPVDNFTKIAFIGDNESFSIKVNASIVRIPHAIYLNFVDGSMKVTYDNVEFELHGIINFASKASYSVPFEATVLFKNFIIAAKKLPKELHRNESKIQVDVDYYQSTTGEAGNHLLNCPDVPYKDQLHLLHVLGANVPSIVVDRFVNNANLSDYLREKYLDQPRRMIVSRYPSFLNNEHQYFYYVPKVPILSLTLNNIRLRGLANYETYSHYVALDEFDVDKSFYKIITVKGVRAGMQFDHGLTDVPFIELNLTVDRLSIFLRNRLGEIKVKMDNASIVQGSCQSMVSISTWLSQYTEIILEYIEIALARTIKPSFTAVPARGPAPTSSIREMEQKILQTMKNVKVNR